MVNRTASLHKTTAVILAGGAARRMHGEDKGLMELNGRPMIEHVIAALEPQVADILISANRNTAAYSRYGYPVIEDRMSGRFGPLAGIASALQACDSERLLSVPCDSPFVPPVLAERLENALTDPRVDISVASDGERMQPVFSLIRRRLLDNLLSYLENGGRAVHIWYASQQTVLVDFSDHADAFININTPADRRRAERIMVGQRQA